MPASLTGRRQFLGGLLATGLVPAPTWADVGSPRFLSAAARSDGQFLLCGIGADLRTKFQLPLPSRGHAAAAHPSRPEAVAFARRPGTFAVVIDCTSGVQKAVLQAPEGRHFYGHGVFSADGSLLFTTENAFEVGQGRVGVWDVRKGYVRVDEWHSGGIGPHDIKRLPGSDTLIVANGGIDTHPDTGRTKLNVPTMRPNLAYLRGGAINEIVEPPAEMHKNSIRHLAVGPDGRVAFGMQWQGDGPAPSLIGTHKRGAPIALMEMTEDQTRAMDGYIGSVAMSSDGRIVAATSPRGGRLQRYDIQSRQLADVTAIEDVCGVATLGSMSIVTAGSGELRQVLNGATREIAHSGLKWDNHLIGL